MKQVSINKAVDASADAVWNILRTGTNLDKWIPFIATCKLEGKGVGAKRVCTTADGKVLKETILLVDDSNRIFKYRIDEQDVLPTKNYVGTVSVKESMGKTEVVWVADFEMTVEAAWPEVEKGLTSLLTDAILQAWKQLQNDVTISGEGNKPLLLTYLYANGKSIFKKQL